MGVPPLLASSERGRAFHSNLFCPHTPPPPPHRATHYHPQSHPAAKKDFRSNP
ncbi:MAG: hypothetical protein LBQ31_07405 [Bacteroidales bacterium]|nr:hypothetical protein [Bacteroidales bacterium]